MSSQSRISNPTGGAIDRVDLRCTQIGVVKEVIDGETMGRLKVWIKNSNTLENDPRGWVTCNYASPFAGASDPEFIGNNTQSYEQTQTSYGWWAIPPDLNNEVLINFINGDIRKAYWFACLYQKDMNNMIPGIPKATTFQNNQFGGLDVASAEYNKTANTSTVRPYYEPLADGNATQGLTTDQLRGAGSSGARRESPSKVTGILTPGGNQFIMDDGVGSELIRLRTASGAQILISETEGHVYAISRDGKSWGELNVDGNVDFYAGANCSVHAINDFNVTAGGNVNIDAGGNINLRATGSINALSTGDLNFTALGNSSLSVKGLYTSTFDSDIRHWQANGKITISDTFNHGNLKNDSRPSNQTPSLQTQSIKNSNKQETSTQTVCSRVPDFEPWAPHAPTGSGSPTPTMEENYDALAGNVTNSATMPLPLVGTPKAGMKSGVYTPVSYDSKNQPVYSYTGKTTALTPIATLTTSQDGLSFIEGQEGLVNTVYNDVGHKAIGIGHNIVPSDPSYIQTGPITDEQAYALLASDLKKVEQTMKKYIKVPLTQSQFDAISSFIFNIGSGSFIKSTLLKELNLGNYSEVPNQFMRWVNVAGKVNQGLVKRRRAEALLFSTPASTN